MGYIIGYNGCVGVAINAETAGETYDGTPGDYEYFRVKPGGFKAEPRLNKNDVEELGVDIEHYVKGGLYWTWTLEAEMSYSYREHCVRLAAGGAISTAGAGPYVHTFALSDKRLCGAIKAVCSDQAAQSNEFIEDTFTNVVVTAFNITESPEGTPTLSMSGIAVTRTPIENLAALPTIQTTEMISWRHLSYSLNGETDDCVGDISLGITQGMNEGEFNHAASTPETMQGITRTGVREVLWSVVTLERRTNAEALVSDTSAEWTGTNSLTWNNAGAAAAEREVESIFGDSTVESAPITRLEWNIAKRAISLKARDASSPRVIALKITNSRVTIA